MTRTLTSDELIHEISEVLAQGDGDFVAEIANKVLVPTVTYDGDSLFTQEVDG
jgi:hypothetical protein